ncbi:uncharacterized protein LOC120277136 [Dioscorea cayenensis subsp. rotundata]|uniref:Uncharacterized protein LOC120277136 n=1 Tax=Dioscorea cayennensis subsp. rotundata TaxID=55577 RepID=A0AB40CMK4_DIOCR|nr:uncharacterized protein LOC120277136 [Dioscorea cayenensis subsp. rotundata]
MSSFHDSLVKNLHCTSQKLDGRNYVFWAQSFEQFLMAHKKSSYLTADPPDSKDAKYADWLAEDAAVRSWLTGSMEPDIARSVVMLTTAKAIWEMCRLTYGNENNISRVFELYEQLFTARQGDRTAPQFFTHIRSLLDELDIYQPLVLDLATLRRYRNEVAVIAYLSGLPVEMQNQVKGSILSSERMPDLAVVYARVLRLSSTSTSPSPVVSSDQSALLASRGRGGKGSSRGGRGAGRGDSRNRFVCTFCRRPGHTEDRCWDKHGRPAMANASTEVVDPSPTSSAEQFVTISQADFARFQQLQGTASHTTVSSSVSSGNAFLASRDSSWIIDSGASSHMTGSADREEDWFGA